MTIILVIGYVLGWAASVPVLARAFYNPEDEARGARLSSKPDSVTVAIANGFIWPFWLVVGTITLLSRALAPLIFRGDR